eukprot:SAG11_NODE_1840_length_4183_cov_8.392018_4_plen_61_part_00
MVSSLKIAGVQDVESKPRRMLMLYCQNPRLRTAFATYLEVFPWLRDYVSDGQSGVSDAAL